MKNYPQESKMGKNTIDIIGDKYGYLTVIGYNRYEKKEKTTYWNCLCDCGATRVIRRSNLLTGKYPSCGCKKFEILSRASSKSKGEASFNEVYRGYKYTANKKNLKFDITKKQFRNLTSKNCFYCNSSPNTKSKTHEKRHNGVYTYNGIDRKNNNKGYIRSNCVSCCEICNRMKLCLGYSQFKNHVTKIFTAMNSKNK